MSNQVVGPSKVVDLGALGKDKPVPVLAAERRLVELNFMIKSIDAQIMLRNLYVEEYDEVKSFVNAFENGEL